MNFKIITDSTADISPEILAEYDITVASLDVIMDGKPHKAVDVPNEVFYAHLNDCLTSGKKLPSTSQVTPFAFEKVLEPYANKEETFVLVLTIGKEMSNTYYSAQKDVVRLADILGHSSINTTRIYTMETGDVHCKQIQSLGLLRC